MPRSIRVLLVDDHPVVREGLRTMLADQDGIEVVGEASSGEEAIHQADELEPDVVLTDIRMPGMDGLEASRRIKAAHPGTCILVLSVYDSDMHAVQAFRMGAAGYLTKDASPDLLCHAIRVVTSGGTLVPGSLLHRAVQGLGPAPLGAGDHPDSAVLGCLSPRELEVLRALSQGKGNKDICAELCLAEVTVKKHVQSIMGKLGLSNRTQAALLGARLGMVV